ncbi:hypothetical protein [Natribacillus halophilus]|uniref:Uncharacterized protein n=1 Tax=Natribacillus halophilus TaxID=549003 RepID=A0A1G8PZ25_9BACI|nr:hypothetical protein [Natribacillus halophilus]SDI97693.1 hypothetical protein SAMN04488123_11019 [Natribacillus halophilus]
MKKMMVAVLVLGFVGGYLFLENSHVKNESQALQQALEQVQDEEREHAYHGQAGVAAERFVEAYFTYEGQPVCENVEPYADVRVLDELQFEEPEMGYDDMEAVQSSVDDVDVYYGPSTDDQQAIVVHFDNAIRLDGVNTSTYSILDMDMVLSDETWKVEALQFYQLP